MPLSYLFKIFADYYDITIAWESNPNIQAYLYPKDL